MIFIGKTLLGYEEEDVWRMTQRKLILLYDEYKKEFGYRDRAFIALHQFFGIQETNQSSDDDVVPGEDVI